MITPIIRAIPLVCAIALTVFAAGHASAEAYYRWIGADGVVHYGSRPPEGVIAEQVDTWGKSAGENAAGSGKASKQGKASLDEQQKELAAQRKQQCDDERERLKALQTGGSRIRMTMEDGTTRYLSTEEIANEIKRSREFVDGACQ